MSFLTDILTDAVARKASDVFLIAGGPISIRVHGMLLREQTPPVTADAAAELVREIYTLAHRSIDGFLASGDDDFSFALPAVARFRVSAYRQRGSMAAVIRCVAFELPDAAALGIPEQALQVAALQHGLVLFAGTAGTGKSTTQACLIDRINASRAAHIITLEDPIEYLHRNKKSIVSQREISIDTDSYMTALRASLRQAPDVIQLGEMRDYETIRAAMTAAETGHLVFATLHTDGAAGAIDRIIDAFPAAQQAQVRIQLAAVLQAVVSQKLLPHVSGDRVPAFEILRTTPAVRSLIRDGKTHQLPGILQTGTADGMLSMDTAILQLYHSGSITRQTALEYAAAPHLLEHRL